jgi:hypothetical protein
MTHSREEQAAKNNAIWCDTICRAHGSPGEFHNELWLNRYAVPRFYPNVVTLSAEDGTATQLTSIQTLAANGLSGGWGVKDSFCSLDLITLGFKPLFEARWLWRSPFQPLPNRAASDLRWAWVKSALELARWETAWSGSQTPDILTRRPRLFLPTMLADPEIGFVAVYQGQTIVAGAIANHTKDLVGLSNVFVPQDDQVSFYAGCVAVTHERFPDMPVVGYERGRELAIVQEIGFEMLQPLKIWIRRV